jgi:hypothetical protein
VIETRVAPLLGLRLDTASGYPRIRVSGEGTGEAAIESERLETI